MRKLYNNCLYCKKPQLDFDAWIQEVAEIKSQIRYFQYSKMMLCDTTIYDLAIAQLDKSLAELMNIKTILTNRHHHRCM